MTIKFVLQIIRLKAYVYGHCQSDDRDLNLRSQVRLKLDYVLTWNISDNNQAITFKLSMTVDLYMAYMLILASR